MCPFPRETHEGQTIYAQTHMRKRDRTHSRTCGKNSTWLFMHADDGLNTCTHTHGCIHVHANRRMNTYAMTDILIRTHRQAYGHVHKDRHINTYTQTDILTRTQRQNYKHVHKDKHINTHTHKQEDKHPDTNRHTNTYPHTFSNVYTHTHTFVHKKNRSVINAHKTQNEQATVAHFSFLVQSLLKAPAISLSF